MANYKLVKIYEEEDKIKIKNMLKTEPIEIKENIVMIKYGPTTLPYFKINKFILKEDMDHVILYADIFLKFIKFFLTKNIKIKKIRLLEIQSDIEERIDILLNELNFDNKNSIEDILKILENYIPKGNIDIEYLKIKTEIGDEIILYNNGVLSSEGEETDFLVGVLCFGL